MAAAVKLEYFDIMGTAEKVGLRVAAVFKPSL